MNSSLVPLKILRIEERCTLNLSRAQTSTRWSGVVVRRRDASSAHLRYELPSRTSDIFPLIDTLSEIAAGSPFVHASPAAQSSERSMLSTSEGSQIEQGKRLFRSKRLRKSFFKVLCTTDGIKLEQNVNLTRVIE
ncbi:hypothetical protein TNCV_4273101 [Trichonephila clavipes]|nr:hypothetical protein TNCV_4273101 [Trichonephila clavipes]